MMRPDDALPAVYLCREPVDFRKGIRTLSLFVEDALGRNPFSERLFVFINRRRDKIKILYWERSGFCLWQKQLEEERFHWPRHLGPEMVWTINGQQLNWLLDGFDLARMKPHRRLAYQSLS